MKNGKWALVLLALAGGCWDQSVTEKPPLPASASTTTPVIPPPPPPDPPSAVFFMDSSWGLLPQGGKRKDVGLLSHELLRQALLLAAREELGLTTRDELLGDAPPADKSVLPFVLESREGPPERLVVRRSGKPRVPDVGDMELTGYDAPDNYTKHAVAAEKYSRTHMVDILKKARIPGKPRVWKADLAVPGHVEKLLAEMVFFSQFEAIRELHQLTAAQGESPAVLGALVRGYTHLGILTERHWNAAHKVFKARALLYAQRWAAREPASLAARWHRAYALALIGAHAEAIADLEAAGKAWQALPAKDRPARPDWVDLVDAYVRYDVPKLAAAADHPEHGPLASLLHFHAVDLSGGGRWIVQTGGTTLSKIPECYRVHDAVCRFGGVSVQHLATVAPATILGRTLYGRVRKMPGLPEAVRREADARQAAQDKGKTDRGDDDSPGMKDEFGARVKLMAALRGAANDAGEPSWTALGDLIQELSFVHVWQRTRFLDRLLSVSPDDFLKTAEPLVANHPYRVGLEALSWNQSQRQEATRRLDGMVPRVLQNHFPMLFGPVDYKPFNPVDANKQGATHTRLLQVHRNTDALAHDYVAYLRNVIINDEGTTNFCRGLLEVSPHSPMARMTLMRIGTAKPEEIAAWDKQAADYPGLAEAFAGHYKKAKQFDRAIPYCEAILKVDPQNLDAYKLLADAYLGKGDEQRWLTTLESALRLPDYGLDHAQIQSQIAHHFMGKADWKRALPYAQGAAESYSGWGLHCLAECYEGMGDFARAERLILAAAERYRTGAREWYYFCRRTGRGDLAAARKAVQEYIDDGGAAADTREKRGGLFTYILLENQLDKTAAFLRDRYAEEPRSAEALWLALIGDETNNTTMRDEALAKLKADAPLYRTTEKERVRTELVQLGEWIQRDVAQGHKGAIPRAEVEPCRAGLKDKADRARFDLLLARYLKARGNRDDAVYYCRQILASITPQNEVHTLAAVMLIEMGVAPDRLQTPVEKQPAAEKPAPAKVAPAKPAPESTKKDAAPPAAKAKTEAKAGK